MSQTQAALRHLFWRFFYANRQIFLYPGLYFGQRRILPLPRRHVYEPPALIEFAEQTVIIAKDQPEYRPLPAYRYQTADGYQDPEGKIVFCWKLGPARSLQSVLRRRSALAHGADVQSAVATPAFID